MAVIERVSEEAYLRLVLEDPSRQWELYDGQLRERPGMTWRHVSTTAYLSHLLQLQLNRDEYEVRINEGRVRRSPANYFIPDILVVPTAVGREFDDRPSTLAISRAPLPLVIEVWSPSTGGYDIDVKLLEYEAREDAEIWRLHPYEQWLLARRRQPHGTYVETRYTGGTVRVESLPNVVIDLDLLFRR